MGWVVVLVELIGGIALILGLLARVAAVLLTIDLAVAILLVKSRVGLIAPQGAGAGAELDLTLMGGFIAVCSPGREHSRSTAS